jgi:hypothetical protein
MSITWNGNAQPSTPDASRKTRKKATAQARQNQRGSGEPGSTEAMRASIPPSGTAQGFKALLQFSSMGPLRWERD